MAPDFAFHVVVHRTRPEEREGLELGCWRVALNGAEPIRAEHEQRFLAAFAGHGVRPDLMSHSYGMAEATAELTAEPEGQRGRFATLDAAALEQGRVSEGQAGGRTRIRGRSVARGYWNAAAATEATFRARRADAPERGDWLRSGDLGFFREGHLHVTGRRKDVIILRGENHYPQDIEWAVQGRHPALRPNAAAAFTPDDGGPERVVLVAEVYAELGSLGPGMLFGINAFTRDVRRTASIVATAAGWCYAMTREVFERLPEVP